MFRTASEALEMIRLVIWGSTATLTGVLTQSLYFQFGLG